MHQNPLIIEPFDDAPDAVNDHVKGGVHVHVQVNVNALRLTLDCGRVSQSFQIPDDFRELMREAVSVIDFGDIGAADGEFAINHDCGRGGRVPGQQNLYRFTYLSQDGHSRWEIELREQQIRDIAAGLLDDV